MQESKTIKEVLEDVVSMLGGIKIPVTEMQSIGVPVVRSINAIKLCLDAMTDHSQNQDETTEEIVSEEVTE